MDNFVHKLLKVQSSTEHLNKKNANIHLKNEYVSHNWSFQILKKIAQDTMRLASHEITCVWYIACITHWEEWYLKCVHEFYNYVCSYAVCKDLNFLKIILLFSFTITNINTGSDDSKGMHPPRFYDKLFIGFTFLQYKIKINSVRVLFPPDFSNFNTADCYL